MDKELIQFIQDMYKTKGHIPLHAPTFIGKEQDYVRETIESTFVSSVGKFVDEFEQKIELYTGSPKAVATVNGTAALHATLYSIGVTAGDYVITQAMTFVATANTIHHLGAEPIFLDIARTSLSLCPIALENFLLEHAELRETECLHKKNNRPIKAVIPMHTFGHPVELDEILAICNKWHLVLIEDAAESLGSFYKGRHTGTIGDFGVLSFNGNKVITTGGGGMILCKNTKEGNRLKHLTTTAKKPHPYEFYHDEPGFNYRLPNINAALGCAQMESLPTFIEKKREIAKRYQSFFENTEFQFISEPSYAKSNYWLNAILCPDQATRNALLESTNKAGVMTRPIWRLLYQLPMYNDCIHDSLSFSIETEKLLVNIPSSPIDIA